MENAEAATSYKTLWLWKIVIIEDDEIQNLLMTQTSAERID